MKKIDFYTGIEGYRTQDHESIDKSKLPDSQNIAPQGGRVKDHVQLHFKRFHQGPTDFYSSMQPKIGDLLITSPGNYLATYRKTLKALQSLKDRSKTDNRHKSKAFEQAISVLETVGDDIQVLNDYVASLKKV